MARSRALQTPGETQAHSSLASQPRRMHPFSAPHPPKGCHLRGLRVASGWVWKCRPRLADTSASFPDLSVYLFLTAALYKAPSFPGEINFVSQDMQDARIPFPECHRSDCATWASIFALTVGPQLLRFRALPNPLSCSLLCPATNSLSRAKALPTRSHTSAVCQPKAPSPIDDSWDRCPALL